VSNETLMRAKGMKYIARLLWIRSRKVSNSIIFQLSVLQCAHWLMAQQNGPVLVVEGHLHQLASGFMHQTNGHIAPIQFIIQWSSGTKHKRL
jgi:hypothetical protein